MTFHIFFFFKQKTAYEMRISDCSSDVCSSDLHDNTKPLTTAAGAPVTNNQDSITAGPRGPMLLQDLWFLEKLAHFDREVIPERRMHAKGSGAFGTFKVTHDISKYTKTKLFSKVGNEAEMVAWFSTQSGST